jgi:Ca2+-dependent lipid-binding protein
MSGNLHIKFNCAKLSRDTETFGKMDPYVVLKIGSQVFKTDIHNDGGKFPSWKNEFNAQLQGNESVVIQVWDKDSASSDDLVGETEMTAAQF